MHLAAYKQERRTELRSEIERAVALCRHALLTSATEYEIGRALAEAWKVLETLKIHLEYE